MISLFGGCKSKSLSFDTHNNSFQVQFFFHKGQVTFCLDENRNCFCWGWNPNSQLGLGDKTSRKTPTLFLLPNEEQVNFVTCGYYFSMCITTTGRCYVWGENSNGQLGLEDLTLRSAPTLLRALNHTKITFISCGFSFSVCLTENNLCYVWGSNNFGQLGFGDKVERHTPTLLTLPNNEKISSLACGYEYILCLTEKGLCYVWGHNISGQLGLGDTDNRYSPTLLQFPTKERVYYVACGAHFSLCLTETNQCYIWGNGKYGELGLGDKIDRLIPTLLTLPNNERIFYISSGNYHNLCLTISHVCYVWGWNNYGQLGQNHRNDCLIPTLFELSKDNQQALAAVYAAAFHSIFKTFQDSYYVCGYNVNGELGLGHLNETIAPSLFPSPK